MEERGRGGRGGRERERGERGGRERGEGEREGVDTREAYKGERRRRRRAGEVGRRGDSSHLDIASNTLATH